MEFKPSRKLSDPSRDNDETARLQTFAQAHGEHDAPLSSHSASQSSSQFVYVGRQPILDRNGALHAYELLFRGSARNYAEVSDDAQATAQVVVRTIGSIGVPSVLGTHRGYVNISSKLLFDDIVHLMQPERFVLEILETVTFDARLIERIAELRRAGFRIALDDVCELSPNLLTVLPYADIVKIDFLQTDRSQLRTLTRTLRMHGKTLIAEKVETRKDFALARELGFHLFQGYFFARPQVLSTRHDRSSRASLMRLLALLAGDAGIVELEDELKRNPNVVMQLLRLVNSSAFGLGRNISSLREAIIATGTRQIARWAQLLLYAGGGDLPWRSDPLVQLAGTRARFMELAARWIRPNDEGFADAAFLTGVFSLVHVLVDSTPGETLDPLDLSPIIRDAIVARAGPMGALLRIAEAAGEAQDAAAIAAIASSQSPAEFAALTPPVLAELNLSAAAWFGAHLVD